MTRILADEDVWAAADYADAVAAMERALLEQAAGTLVAPPRWRVPVAEAADLVFTAGSARAAGVCGFRAYETFPERTDEHQGLVAVWDAEDGRFRGLVVGGAVGVLRTGGIGGVAVDALAAPSATTLGVLGSGTQARAQIEAVDAARDLEAVRIYSPTAEHRRGLAGKLDDRLGPDVAAVADAEAAVRGADVLVCATDSEAPVFEADWLEAGCHVTSIGPKAADGHELPTAAVDRADRVVTDSLAQLAAGERPSLVDPATAVELGPVVAGERAGRRRPEDVTLFCSVGLAGTEVVLAADLLG